ncbi:MAG: hypothetical protein AAGF11_41090 [Myxococcota bacterium]
MKRLAFAAVTVLAVQGCGDDEGDDLADPSDTSLGDTGGLDDTGSELGAEIDCRDQPLITHQTFGQGFISGYCGGCHGGEVTGDARQGAPPATIFDTEPEVQMWADRIYARVLWGEDSELTPMPPVGGVVQADIDRFRVWMVCDLGVSE